MTCPFCETMITEERVCPICKQELYMEDLFGDEIFIGDYLEEVEDED